MENIISGNLTLGLLFVASAIFVWLGVKSKTVKSFQCQISIFVLIWIAGELIGVMQEKNLLETGIGDIGMQIHLVSMVFLSGVLWLRYYTSKRSNKKTVEELDGHDN